MIPERRRVTYALLLSLLIHALLLSLNFGGWELWFPNFRLLWQDQRIDGPDLRVVIVPEQVAGAESVVTPSAAPMEPAPVEHPVASEPTSSEPRASSPTQTATTVVPKADRTAEANLRTDAATAAPPPVHAPEPGENAPPSTPAPEMIALPPTDEPTWLVPAIPAAPTPVTPAVPSPPSPEPARDAGDATRPRIEPEAPERATERPKPDTSKEREAERLEAARAEAARIEAERAAAARAEAARIEAERAAAAREEAARAEAERAAAAREEAARAEAEQAAAERAEAARAEAERAAAAREEAARAEAERAAAARAEAARAEAERAAAAREEAARVEAERAAAARAEAARVEAERALDASREAARRAMGRQLDEEAAQRQSATASTAPTRSLPPPWSLRRYKLFGRTDPNAELIRWVEAWARKIQLNMTFDMVREAAKQPHTDPVVTVAVRSDGSVESVTFVLSSGVAAIDDAIRRIVESQAPYPVFPPGLAREWDVIEIRRTWYFDVAIRLY